jgi:hypothetical protein
MLSKPDGAGTAREVWAIAGVALAARLAIVLALPSGEPGDMAGWVETARRVTVHGLHAGYAVLAPGSLYPPAFLYPLWVTGQAYMLCCSPGFDTGTRTLDVFMRLGPIVADTFLTVLVYVLARRWSDRARARWASLLYALNPAVLATVAWKGMVGDPYYLVLIMVALLGALKGRAVPAAFCLTLGVLTKPQALAFVPLVSFVLLSGVTRRQVLTGLAVSVLTTLGVLLPFVLYGTLGEVWAAVQQMGSIHAYTQNSADNLWILLPVWGDAATVPGSYGEVPDSGILVAGLTYQASGLLAFAALSLLMLARLAWAGTLRLTVLAGAVIGIGFFFLNTRMHVNYVFLAFPFLCALAPSGDLRLRLALGTATLACLVDWDALAVLPWAVHRINAALYGTTFLLLCLTAFQPWLSHPSLFRQAGRRGQASAP